MLQEKTEVRRSKGWDERADGAPERRAARFIHRISRTGGGVGGGGGADSQQAENGGGGGGVTC